MTGADLQATMRRRPRLTTVRARVGPRGTLSTLSFDSTPLHQGWVIVHAITVDTDECDACTDAHVQAFLYAEMPSGHTLSYCGNHGTRYLDGLTRQGAKIIDLRHLIEP